METIISEERIAEDQKSSAGKVVMRAKGLRKAFGGQIVFNDISLELKQGDVVLLQGENGSGKTTLLNILTGNLEPDKGDIQVEINGNKENFSFPRPWWKELNPFDHFTPERLAWEGVGRVWQDLRLFPTMTTMQNVSVGSPKVRGENPIFMLSSTAKAEERKNLERSAKWLEVLGLGDRLDSSCDKLSLGQMKRVALARAVQAGAKVLFLDEPLSGLDRKGIEDIIKYLRALVQEWSVTLVIVEHVFNTVPILEIANKEWTLSEGKLTESTWDTDSKEDTNNKSHSTADIMKSLSSQFNLITILNYWMRKISSTDLPNGATLTKYGSKDLVEFDRLPSLEIKELNIDKGIRKVINRLSFECRKGEIILIEAPNGWGKSTLLDAIAGIHDNSIDIIRGSIAFKGREISSFQPHQIARMGISYLRANERVFYSLKIKDQMKLKRSSNVVFEGSLDENKEGCLLSGGEKQKLLIDLLPDADVCLMDEPMIGLDDKAAKIMFSYINNMIKEGKTMLITIPSVRA